MRRQSKAIEMKAIALHGRSMEDITEADWQAFYNRPQQVKRRAYHEAGHHIIAALLEFKLVEVSIDLSRVKQVSSDGEFANTDLAGISRVRYPISPEQSTREFAIRRAVITMAGPSAEKLVDRKFGSWIAFFEAEESGDGPRTMMILKEHLGEAERLAVWTTKLVRTHWKTVSALAEALIKRRTLVADESWKIIDRLHPRGFQLEAVRNANGFLGTWVRGMIPRTMTDYKRMHDGAKDFFGQHVRRRSRPK